MKIRDANCPLHHGVPSKATLPITDWRLNRSSIKVKAGLPYFGADCRAAFYETQNPTVTVDSEPMIGEAVGNFRALGVLA